MVIVRSPPAPLRACNWLLPAVLLPAVLLPAVLLAAAVLLWCAPARATPVGTIFSGPTSADGGAVYWNPAGMTRVDGTHAMIFGGATYIQLQHQRATPNLYDGAMYPEASIALFKPNMALGIVTDLGLSGLPDSPLNNALKELRMGVGIAVPVIEGTSWEAEYQGRPASTRYYATFAYQALLYLEVALAYRFNKYISVGVGMDVIGALVNSNQVLDFGAKINQIICVESGSTSCPVNGPVRRENPAFDATVKVEGQGWGTGGMFGILLSFPPWVHAGLGFHSGAGTIQVPININVDMPQALVGYMKQHLPSFSLPPLHATAQAEVSSPMILTAGVAVLPLPGLEVSVDLHWVDTSATTEMLVHIANTTSALIGDQVLVKTKLDSYMLGWRGSYQLFPNLKLGLRLEYSSNTRPETFVTPVSMDFHIVSLQAGVGWQATGWLALTLEYGHYFLIGRTINVSNFGPNASPSTPVEEGFDKPSPTGEYTGMADSLAVGILLSF